MEDHVLASYGILFKKKKQMDGKSNVVHVTPVSTQHKYNTCLLEPPSTQPPFREGDCACFEFKPAGRPSACCGAHTLQGHRSAALPEHTCSTRVASVALP